MQRFHGSNWVLRVAKFFCTKRFNIVRVEEIEVGMWPATLPVVITLMSSYVVPVENFIVTFLVQQNHVL